MYNRYLIIDIQTIYILMTIIWAILVFSLGLWKTDIVGVVIILIPLVVFAISYFSLESIDEECSNTIGRFNIISFALLAATILINWQNNSPIQNWIRSLVVIATLLLVISIIDIWASKDNREVFLHFRTAIQTMSIVLLAYALYQFYAEICTLGNCCPIPPNSSLILVWFTLIYFNLFDR